MPLYVPAIQRESGVHNALGKRASFERVAVARIRGTRLPVKWPSAAFVVVALALRKTGENPAVESFRQGCFSYLKNAFPARQGSRNLTIVRVNHRRLVIHFNWTRRLLFELLFENFPGLQTLLAPG